MVAARSRSRAFDAPCPRCGKSLDSLVTTTAFQAKPPNGPPMTIKGLPALGCSECGAHMLTERGKSVLKDIASTIARPLEKAAALGRLDDVPLTDCWSSLVQHSVSVSFGQAEDTPTTEPSAEKALTSIDRVRWTDIPRADLVVPPDLDEAIQDFVAQIRDGNALREALGGGLEGEAARHFLGLHGPPGSGKTSIAREIARRLERDLFVVRASELESSKVGESEKNIDQAFAAVRSAGAVLFIDEADSLVDARVEGADAHARYVNSVRNTFICNLNRHEGVVLFATNLRRRYDPAIARRLEDLHVPAPDAAMRTRIWSVLLRGMTLEQPATSEWVETLDARVTEHERVHGDPARPISAADIRMILKKAASRALRRRQPSDPLRVARSDIEVALDRHLSQLAAASTKAVDPQRAMQQARAQLAALVRREVERFDGRKTGLADDRPSTIQSEADYKHKADALLKAHERIERMMIDTLRRVAGILATDSAEDMLEQLQLYAASTGHDARTEVTGERS